MKKTLYKFAAMDVIVGTLHDKCMSLRAYVERKAAYYVNSDVGIPAWEQAENDKTIAIAEYIENFIDKLC
nr:MAG TPA: hypothetical protein [Caudoviricetes sp.]